MQIQTLSIPEVKILTPARFGDDRGYFTETFNKKHFAGAIGAAMDSFEFVQDNQSMSAATGTIRGLHYQAPPYAQGKLVRVLSGRIYDVAVDARQGSPTFGRWVAAELTAAGGEQIWVPEGFLHGFATLEPDVVVAYKVTAFYDKASDGAVSFADPDLAIDWPVASNDAIVSDKDRAAPSFRDFVSPFTFR